MDEIICSECGRPNLPEAVKCWYCQHPLEIFSDNQSFETTADENLAAKDSKEPLEVFENQSEEKDIPEWLKRVREQVRNDQEIEEEEKWKQEGFFRSEESAEFNKNDSGRAKQKPRGKQKKKPVEKPIQEKLVGEQAMEADHLINNQETEEDTELNVEESDLPDGFIQLPSEDV
jgi:hypothetical protein